MNSCASMRTREPRWRMTTMSERTRLTTLCARGGVDAAKAWAQSAIQLYRQAMENPAHFASQLDWKPRFEASIRELAAFIERGTLDDESHS